ncbi:CBS domain-containing protein, partial [Veillonella sp.]
MKIQEVMNKYPVTVGKDAPISDVADLLVKYNLTAVSVVDDNNKLLGIISEGDLL